LIPSVLGSFLKRPEAVSQDSEPRVEREEREGGINGVKGSCPGLAFSDQMNVFAMLLCLTSSPHVLLLHTQRSLLRVFSSLSESYQGSPLMWLDLSLSE
jgi:hypothetical protein